MSFPSIYLRGLHWGLVEGDALDIGQPEVLFSEQLCERVGQGSSVSWWAEVSVGAGQGQYGARPPDPWLLHCPE